MATLTVSGIRCVVIGDEPLAAQCATIARDAGLEVVALATVHPAVERFGADEGIATVRSDGDLVESLADTSFEILLSVANLRIVASDLLRRAQVAVNFHDGPLPGYAGLNVTSWSLLDEVTRHEVTWHLMTDGVDEGEIVTTEGFDVAHDDTAFALNARCYEAALASFPRVAAAIASGSVETTPQPSGEARMFRRRDRPARIVDLAASSAADISRLVRSLDLGHLSTNAIGVPLVFVGDRPYIMSAANPTDGNTGPGQVVSAGDRLLRVGTSEGDLEFELTEIDGTAASPDAVLGRAGITVGAALESPDAAMTAAFADFDSNASVHERFWRQRLVEHPPSQLALGDPTPRDEGGDADAVATWHRVARSETKHSSEVTLARLALCVARSAGRPDAVFDVTEPSTRTTLDSLGSLARAPRLAVDTSEASTLDDLVDVCRAELERVRRTGPLLTDLVARDPSIDPGDAAPLLRVALDAGSDALDTVDASILVSVSATDGTVETWQRGEEHDRAAVERFAEQLETVLALDGSMPLREVEILGASERELLEILNRTDVERDQTATVDGQIWSQASSTPDATAVSFGSTSWTYAELRSTAEAFSVRLAAAGVGRGDRVGIALPRGLDMLVGVLATMRLGAAYVPLDPAYPADRLDYMVDDAGLSALLARGPLATQLGRPGLVTLDPAMASDDPASSAPAISHDPQDLAYVIYTSGSTGKPKGVMLQHTNVANFFVAMDDVIDHDPPGVWLAVTSLSFDISVLELLWTLARGFHVVIKAESGFESAAESGAASAAVSSTVPTRPVSMSLFYFAAGDASDADGYRLLLDGAKFADENGFEAIWTPERHFHAFGGAYPNPSVVSAAIAATTTNLAIRAGSVVLPLHSPVRVAEEWSVVDNISNGRVGISFAPGWQPNDFVLNPARYGRARSELPGLIDVVHRLWRGESVDLEGHDGEPVSVTTLPRPVQAELPTWLTSAGTPATFEQAGRSGVNVLTHLLGQGREDLSANIERYRNAWKEAGHEGEGHVTLMLHTYLDTDAGTAKEAAREPMKSYLGTAVGLIKNMASSFPTFAGSGKDADEAFASLTEDELDQLLEMAAARYLDSSGLFGTADDAADTIVEMAGLGVDEVACLIDFGLDTDQVISSFPLLQSTKQMVDARISEASESSDSSDSSSATIVEPRDAASETVAALVAEHGVTHLQCTPSLAAMLSADPADRAALGTIGHLMLGGEALPAALGKDLRALLPGRFTNMYGPTETTIWSLVHEIEQVESTSIPIGKPIANTTVHVLSPGLHPRPVGAFGELFIGGDGVAPGYHERAELTAERFIDHGDAGRLYATGDVVRVHPDGYVEFAGRADNQLKIRGHRIELGEIEAVIDGHPDVAQSVVVARGLDAEPFLVAFVVTDAAHDTDIDADALRALVAETLPSIMVPAHVVRIASFPFTPNGKVDRNALPTDIASTATQDAAAAPADDGERVIADVWADALGRPVGRDDNFFEIGGHSLLAVRVFRTLTDAIDAPLALTDLFRYPTVRTLATHVASATSASAGGDDAPERAAGAARGERRRRAMAKRGG